MSNSGTLLVSGTLLNMGTAVSLTASNNSQITINGNTTFLGALTLSNNATVTVNNGATLTVGSAVFSNNAIIIVNAGGTLISNGNVTMTNNTIITDNGTIKVNGNVTGSNSATINGSGSLQVTGTTSIPVNNLMTPQTWILNGSTLTYTGNVAVGETFTSGAATVASLNSTGNITDNGNLSVTGTSNLTGAVTTNSLTSGATKVSSLSSIGNITDNGNLSVAGTTSLTGVVTTGSLISGATTVSSLHSTNGISASTLTISGNSIFGGTLQNGSFAGTGSRVILTDLNGNISPLSSGTSSQVLYGNGQWGNLPIIPMQLWNQSSSNIYYSGNVGIGNNNPQAALDVTGNTIITGTLTTGGLNSTNSNLNVTTPAVFTNSVNIASLVVSGTTSLNQLNIAQTISSPQVVTSHIMPADSNGVHIGDSSMWFNTYPDGSSHYCESMSTVSLGTPIGTSTSSNLHGMGIGNFARAYGINSIAIGFNTLVNYSTGSHAIVIGSGLSGNPMVNSTPNSLAVGFNSTVPTLVVTGGTGVSGSIGNVGIGTTTPSYNLHVVSAVGTNANTSVYSGLGNATSWVENNISSYGLNIDAHGNGHLLSNINSNIANPSFTNPPTYIINFTPAGLVGIAQLTPNAMLDITTSGTTAGFNINNGSQGIFNIANDGSTTITSTSNSNNQTNSPFKIVSTTNSFNSGSDNRLFEVKYNGIAYAREVYVQISQFPDYVFEKEYKLMSLMEVEKYIQQNKHLPNVISADEVSKNDGTPLGALQKATLEKTEELYLYIIELNKKVEHLEEHIKELESKK
jgi:hypothetical protein